MERKIEDIRKWSMQRFQGFNLSHALSQPREPMHKTCHRSLESYLVPPSDHRLAAVASWEESWLASSIEPPSKNTPQPTSTRWANLEQCPCAVFKFVHLWCIMKSFHNFCVEPSPRPRRWAGRELLVPARPGIGRWEVLGRPGALAVLASYLLVMDTLGMWTSVTASNFRSFRSFSVTLQGLFFSGWSVCNPNCLSTAVVGTLYFIVLLAS